MTRPVIAVLATGGTIAGTAAAAHDNIGYAAAQLGIGELLAGIPSLHGLGLVTEQVAQIDSKDMEEGVWRALVVRCAHWLAQPDVRGIVVTHGTDTLEETAFLLHSLLAPAKPVVFTCAMRPATALLADGPQNLVDAVAVASSHGASGVVAVCAGVIHGACEVRKRHTYRLDAFGSGDSGPVGYVEEGRLRLLRPWPAGAAAVPEAMQRALSDAPWPRVEIVTSHGGADGRIVDALVDHGVRGIVVAGTGNGSVHHLLEAALQRAQQGGVRVVRATRVARGPVIARDGSSFESAQGLPPVKARIALQLALMAGAPANPKAP